MTTFEVDVDEPVDITVSHSQLGAWDRCRFAWHLSYVEEWTPIKKKSFFDLGNLYHDLVAIHYSNPGKDTTVEREQLIRERLAAAHLDGDALDAAQKAGWLAKRYIDDYAPFNDAGWKVLGVEQHISVVLTTPVGRRYRLHGYLDLLLNIQGKIWLVDHKTVGGGKFYNATQCMMDNQMPTYAAILRHLGVDVFGIIFNMANTYQYKDKAGVSPEKLFRRELTYRTPTELDNCLLELGNQVDDICENRSRIHRSLKRDCSFCQFQEPCLLSLKGMAIDDVMSTMYKRKENARGSVQQTERPKDGLQAGDNESYNLIL